MNIKKNTGNLTSKSSSCNIQRKTWEEEKARKIILFPWLGYDDTKEEIIINIYKKNEIIIKIYL